MDPIANMLTMIRNAQAVNKETVKVPYSSVKHGIADILAKQGFVLSVEKKEKKDTKPYLVIDLKYFEGGRGALTNAKRISTPGRRMYAGAAELKEVKGGHGTSIISTSQGLMTGGEAKKKGLGGEIMCEIW